MSTSAALVTHYGNWLERHTATSFSNSAYSIFLYGNTCQGSKVMYFFSHILTEYFAEKGAVMAELTTALGPDDPDSGFIGG